jgi:TrmH family RNA methyltransferase
MDFMPMITSPQNPRVKNAIRLRNARQRGRQGRIIIDGVTELSRAVSAGVRIIEIFVCESLFAGAETHDLFHILMSSGGDILYVSRAVFEKMAFGCRAEGLLGVAEMPGKTLDDLERPHPNPLPKGEGTFSGPLPNGEGTFSLRNLPEGRRNYSPYPSEGKGTRKNPLIAVLEGVEKPGNIGAVLRSADAAGVSALILADARTDLYNPNAIRASLGTIFTLPVCEATSEETLRWLREKDISIIAARVDGSAPYTEIDYCRPTAVVLGSEAAGLSPAWTAPDITAVRLPMLGAADSLNVSATAAVIFYEALRQRNENIF